MVGGALAANSELLGVMLGLNWCWERDFTEITRLTNFQLRLSTTSLGDVRSNTPSRKSLMMAGLVTTEIGGYNYAMYIENAQRLLID